MPINANYEYANAEEKYLQAQTDEERILALEEMLRVMPKHKGSENLKANLSTRYRKLKEKIEKDKKSKKGKGKQGIKKEKLDNVPVILLPDSTLKDVAEKILHGYSRKVKYAKITGPSCKFPNQKIGLKHVVKDKDVVEFFTE